jgi:hypothetical protein
MRGKKKTPRKNFMAQATELHSKAVRERDGRCLAFGAYGVSCAGYLQCCHIIGRGELCVRTQLDNAVTMCAAHHRFFTSRPAAWENWIRTTFPGRWDRLRHQVRRWYEAGCPSVDWKAERSRLKQILENSEAA